MFSVEIVLPLPLNIIFEAVVEENVVSESKILSVVVSKFESLSVSSYMDTDLNRGFPSIKVLKLFVDELLISISFIESLDSEDVTKNDRTGVLFPWGAAPDPIWVDTETWAIFIVENSKKAISDNHNRAVFLKFVFFLFIFFVSIV